jgi:alkylation response protein AidB-like acyl-CoA dehydrogenase
MNFEHTEERRMLADSLRRLITEQYGFEERKHLLQSAPGMSRDMWSQLAEMGVIGALFREEDGGYGGGGFDIAVVFEEIGRGLLLEPLLGSAILVGEAIAAAGTPAQKAMLEQIIAGHTLAALAHEEADSHYAPTHVAARATQEADGGWRLQGHKAVVVQAEAADVFLVSARTSGQTTDAQGISLFLIPANTAGLQLQGSDTIDGGRVADLLLQDVRLPAEAVLGSVGQGDALLERILGRGVLALCAEALGAMEVAKEATLDYLRTRKQFGLPIGSFQALQHRMADLLLEVEQARSAVINAAAALEADRLTRERALSAAKFSIGRIGTLVAEESIQLHGGIGMTWELPLSHYAKRLVMIDHQLGDEDYHLQRYIALSRDMPA